MDVPLELLVPPEAYGRGFCPADAALVLDEWLRRLAAQEACCRAVLGRLAHAFLRRRGHHDLGFGRLGDYSRERLGISARELQSLATVSARLERLPRLRAAFADGVLGWAQLRLLVTVATPEDENDWLARAEGRTVRALPALIRTPPDGEEDDEARFRLRCPRRVRLLWQQVVELGRRMAGSELTQGQAAEAIAAEGLSARTPVRRSVAVSRAAEAGAGGSRRDPSGLRRSRLECHPRGPPRRRRRHRYGRRRARSLRARRPDARRVAGYASN